MTSRALLIPILAALAACQDAPDPAAGDALSQEQTLAARHACASQELVRTAQDDLTTLESSLAGASGAGASVTTFQRAFLQHAELRATAYAHMDSAVNASPSPTDSARHMRTAEGISISVPDAGSLAANVIESYEQKAAQILGDADHPCNWRHELEN